MIALALWDFYYACNPLISPTFLDPHDPFAAPFAIVNQSRWFTLYDIHPGCIPNAHGNFPTLKAEGAISQLGRNQQGQDISAGGTLQYKCPITGVGLKPDRLNIVIVGTYDIHLIPHIFQFARSFRSESIQWWFDSQGNPHWLVGKELK